MKGMSNLFALRDCGAQGLFYQYVMGFGMIDYVH